MAKQVRQGLFMIDQCQTKRPKASHQAVSRPMFTSVRRCFLSVGTILHWKRQISLFETCTAFLQNNCGLSILAIRLGKSPYLPPPAQAAVLTHMIMIIRRKRKAKVTAPFSILEHYLGMLCAAWAQQTANMALIQKRATQKPLLGDSAATPCRPLGAHPMLDTRRWSQPGSQHNAQWEEHGFGISDRRLSCYCPRSISGSELNDELVGFP